MASRLALVPVLHGLQKIGGCTGRARALVTSSFVLEVVEQRARHAHVVGDVLDGGAGQALLVQLARGDNDLRRALGRRCCGVPRVATPRVLFFVRLHEGPPVFKRTCQDQPAKKGAKGGMLCLCSAIRWSVPYALPSLSLSRQVSVTSLSLSDTECSDSNSNGEFFSHLMRLPNDRVKLRYFTMARIG